MKIKEIARTANVAWSPAAHHPIFLAAGTAAQQLDATFSTTAALEIYALNFTEPGLDMFLKGSVECDHRFYKIAWGCHGMSSGENISGLIVGGTERGNLLVYDPVKLINGETAVVFENNKHEGPVYSLDFNLFQTNLLASGSADSEIYIWDLNNPDVPVKPGSVSQPPEEVCCVAWNKQVQHILASTFPSRCVIWDLRKSEPIIKVTDSSAKPRYKAVAWHPEVATQLCLASEDDHSPIIQLWDLRFATTPLKTLEHHQRGVLSIAWCPHDPDLLLSCGKDNRILCWNPNCTLPGGQVLCELTTTDQWSFDVTWCPRNPAVIASSSFDGHISVYSLMGSRQQFHSTPKVVDSFPSSDLFSTTPTPQASFQPVSHVLQKAPKWLRKPVGASFGFGGKLVHFSNHSGQEHYLVNISQIVTEEELLKRAASVEAALNSGQLAQFCQEKIEVINNPQQKMLWSFLQASFDESPRTSMLSLLGYNPQEVDNQLDAETETNSEVTQEMLHLSVQEKPEKAGGDAFDAIASFEKEAETFFEICTDTDEPDGMLTKALLTGNIEAAVNLCIKDGHWSEALILAQAGGTTLMASAQKQYLASAASRTIKLISAVVTCDWAHIVKKCELSCWKEALAAVLTYAKPEEFGSLCENLGARLEKEENLLDNAMLCYICAGNLEKLAKCWLKINPEPTPISLQDLVEQVVILKQTVDQGSSNNTLQTGYLSNLLGKYAGILAMEGSLSMAMTYIINISEPNLDMLRDRICHSLGLQSTNFPFQKIEVQSQPEQKKPTPTIEQRRPSMPTSQPYQPTQMKSQVQAPNTSNFSYQPVPMQTPFLPQPPGHSLPPTTPATEPAMKSQHLPHRYPSHVQDPSVYNQPSYSQPVYNQPAGCNYAPQTFYSMENSYSRTSQPAPVTSFAPSYHPYEVAQPPPSPSPVPNLPQPHYVESKTSWNDPPPLKSSRQRTSSYQSQDAITTPIMGVQETLPAPGGTFYTSTFPEQALQQSVEPPAEVQPEQAPEFVKEKGLIPPEHQVLQDMFEDLRQQCQQVASNPQIRRKLDDVARKLESLYDKLRENMLSNSTTSGLHQLIQSIQQGDYPTSLLIHSQLVSSGNFSETSSFLPGLKVLIQIAQQLGVYLR